VTRLRACLVAAAAVTTAAAGTTALVATNAQGATNAATALSNRWYAAAPYLMPTDNNPPDAGAIMDATGLKAFQLAFVLAPNGGGCTPTWDGTSPVSSDTAVQSVINTIRAKGGDVSVSIGGYGGTKLGQTCGRPGLDRGGLPAGDHQVRPARRSTSTWRSRSTRTPRPSTTRSARPRSSSRTTPACTSR
jgi:chitinase